MKHGHALFAVALVAILGAGCTSSAEDEPRMAFPTDGFTGDASAQVCAIGERLDRAQESLAPLRFGSAPWRQVQAREVDLYASAAVVAPIEISEALELISQQVATYRQRLEEIDFERSKVSSVSVGGDQVSEDAGIAVQNYFSTVCFVELD